MPISDVVETGRPIKIKDEGITLVSNIASIDFTGIGVTGSFLGADVTEEIVGGGGSNSFLDGTVVRDVNNRISTVSYNGGSTYTVTRDGNNLISSITDAVNTWSFTRDANNYIISWIVT